MAVERLNCLELLSSVQETEDERAAAETERVALYNEIKAAYENGDFNGEKGEKGEKGDKGEKGEKGEKGDSGGASHIVNGTADGSYRSTLAIEETGGYKLGKGAVAEGWDTAAPGECSHAEGYYTTAYGYCSHAEGEGTQALCSHQHVEGRYNIPDAEGKYVHITGNGEAGVMNSNAFTVEWDGTGWFQGAVYVGEYNEAERSLESKKLATEEYVRQFVNDKSLGITNATVGQIIKVKTVDENGKPTAWEAVNAEYIITVTATTYDNVTVTGQTVTIRAGDANGAIYATAEYNGSAVNFKLHDGFAYYVEITNNLSGHFSPTAAKGVINGAAVAVTLTYSDFSSIATAANIQDALNADIDLTDLIGEQISCQKSGATLTWDVVDYDGTNKVVTLMTHDVLPTAIPFDVSQALMYCANGLAAGNYSYTDNGTTYYITLTQPIPAGGQLFSWVYGFETYASPTTAGKIEQGSVSTTAISGATHLGTLASGELNTAQRISNGSNTYGESGIRQWLNSAAAANTIMPQITKLQRPYSVNVAGFMNGLDADFLACIADTEWRCSPNETYACPSSLGGITTAGVAYTVTDKFALPDIMELFGSYDGVSAGNTIFDLFDGASAADRIKYYSGAAKDYWTRSPHRYAVQNERYVSTTGANSINTVAGNKNVSVCCKIVKTA